MFLCIIPFTNEVVMFSVESVILSTWGGGPHVINSHDALDLTVQSPLPAPRSRHRTSLHRDPPQTCPPPHDMGLHVYRNSPDMELYCTETPWPTAGARSKNSATNHSTFQKTSELFSIGGGHVVPVVNNTTCFSIYKWLLFLLLFSSYFPLLSHSFLK